MEHRASICQRNRPSVEEILSYSKTNANAYNAFSNDDDGVPNDLESEIQQRVKVALDALRKEKQPKLDMQARSIAKYRATRDQL